MYIDFEDYRPEIPRVPSAISRSNGIFLAFNLHLLVLLLIMLFPDAFRGSSEQAEPLSQIVPAEAFREVPRFVYMEPPAERPAPPRPRAPLSDLDRRATTPLRPPVIDNPDPFSEGNTRDRVVGTPEKRRVGPDGPGEVPSLKPVQPAPPNVTNGAGSATPLPALQQPPAGGGRLGDSLRNLQRYLQDQNFSNPRGGAEGPQDPLIQFDSKGVEFGPWIRRFLAQVKRNWYIPEAARLLRGRVSIKFVVYRDGRLANIDVIRPSDVEQFTAAAFNALRLSNPTLPLPAEYPDETIDIIVTFLYNEDRRP